MPWKVLSGWRTIISLPGVLEGSCSTRELDSHTPAAHTQRTELSSPGNLSAVMDRAMECWQSRESTCCWNGFCLWTSNQGSILPPSPHVVPLRECEVVSVVSDSAAPWTVAHQAPLSMGFSRQEYWSGLPCPAPADLPNPGIDPTSLKPPASAGRFFSSSWEAPYSFREQSKPSVDKKQRTEARPFWLRSLGRARWKRALPACLPRCSDLLGTGLCPPRSRQACRAFLSPSHSQLSKLRRWWIFKFLNLRRNNLPAIPHITMQEGNRCVFLWFWEHEILMGEGSMDMEWRFAHDKGSRSHPSFSFPTFLLWHLGLEASPKPWVPRLVQNKLLKSCAGKSV